MTSFEGRNLIINAHTFTTHLLIWALVNLQIFASLWWPFFYPFLPLVPPEVFRPYVLGRGRPKGSADLCTSSGTHPPPPFAHTPVTKVCPVISQKISKWHAPWMCSQRHAAKICTLGLNLSMTLGAGTFLTGSKKKISGREKSNSSTVPTPKSPIICLRLTCPIYAPLPVLSN